MKMTLRIGGMHCAACSRAVERALKKTEGVKEANVNIATEKAVLVFDDKKLKYKDIVKFKIDGPDAKKAADKIAFFLQ